MSRSTPALTTTAMKYTTINALPPLSIQALILTTMAMEVKKGV